MAYDQIHIVDATSQMIEVALRSSTTGQLLTGKAYGDMTVKYQREGAAAATTVSVVTATKGSYTSGGFVETDIAGLYQFGIPNAAIATGAKAVTITFICTGAIDAVKRIVLIGADLRNANSLGLAYLTGAVALEATLTAMKGATFSGATDSLEALRDRGDAAWITATGFATPTNITAASGVALTSAYDAAKTAATQTSVDDLPTNSELATALGTADDATLAAIAALNNLSSAQAQSAAAAALTAYDPPTNAELEARTLVAANYFDPAADAVARVTLVDTTTTLTNMPAAAPSAADIKTELEADGSKLDHLWEMTEDDLGTRRLTANALEQAPAGGGTSDLDELIASHDTEDTLGNVLNDLVEEIGGLYRLTTAALAMAPGGGATTYSYSNTIDDGSGNMLDGVFIQCATDTGFTNIVNTATTNALGAFTVYSDVAGTHYLRLQLAGYTFAIQTVTLA